MLFRLSGVELDSVRSETYGYVETMSIFTTEDSLTENEIGFDRSRSSLCA